MRFDVEGDLVGTLTSAPVLRILTLASGGALVDSFAPLPVHSVHAARLGLKNEECDVRVRVRHVSRVDGDARRYMLGLEFLELAPRAAILIAELLAVEGDEAVQL